MDEDEDTCEHQSTTLSERDGANLTVMFSITCDSCGAVVRRWVAPR